MSLFPLAALVKEPRFIPPHRLAVRRRYKWLPSENMRVRVRGEGWGSGGRGKGRGYPVAARKKMFVGPGGGRRRRGKLHEKFRIGRTIPSPFLPVCLLILLLCPLRQTRRVSAFYALNDGPLPLFPPRHPPALASG